MDSAQVLIDLVDRVLPEFAIDPDWRQERLGYPIANDLARFICLFAAARDSGLVNRGLSILKRLLESGDPHLQDLARECVESISDSREAAYVEQQMSPAVLKIFKGR